MKPCQVPISGFGGDIKSLKLLGVGFYPTPQVGVTVGKGQHATVSMSAGCGVLPSPARGSRLNGEVTVVDAVGVLIHKDHGLGRARPVDLVHLGLRRSPRIDKVDGRIATHLTIDRIAAGADQIAPINFQARQIRRSFVNLGAGVVGEQPTITDVQLVSRPWHAGNIAANPRVGGAEIIGNDAILIVDGVHQPSQLHLLEVAHALDAGGLRLSLGQCGKEHAGKNCDDGDNYQQFDEREGFLPEVEKSRFQ